MLNHCSRLSMASGTTASIMRSRKYLGEHGKVAQLLFRSESPEMTEDYTMLFDADIERLNLDLIGSSTGRFRGWKGRPPAIMAGIWKESRKTRPPESEARGGKTQPDLGQ
jgi:hypothetical protein